MGHFREKSQSKEQEVHPLLVNFQYTLNIPFPGLIHLSLKAMKRLIFPVLTGFTLSLAPAAQAENLAHIQQLLSTQQCTGCDLSGAGLVYANLLNADLSGANLKQANLSRSNLRGANLSEADLSGANLVNANLSGANLNGANLSGADLRGAILTGATLQGARLDGMHFLGAVDLPEELATVDNLYNLGLAEAERGNFQGAITQFNRILEVKPDSASAYLARSLSRFRLGDRMGAMEDAQQAQQLYQQQNNQTGAQMSAQVLEGIEAVQEAQEKQEENLQGNGIGTTVLSLLGSVASVLLQFGLP